LLDSPLEFLDGVFAPLERVEPKLEVRLCTCEFLQPLSHLLLEVVEVAGAALDSEPLGLDHLDCDELGITFGDLLLFGGQALPFLAHPLAFGCKTALVLVVLGVGDRETPVAVVELGL
jgi:hypothetical protein